MAAATGTYNLSITPGCAKQMPELTQTSDNSQAALRTRIQEQKPKLSELIKKFESDDPSPAKMPRPPPSPSLHLQIGRKSLPKLNSRITKPSHSLSPKWKGPQPSVDSQTGAVCSAVIGLHKSSVKKHQEKSKQVPVAHWTQCHYE